LSGRLTRVQDWEGVARKAGFQAETMAALCSTSLRTLERYFAATHKTTPTLWARHLRCEIARRLISEGWKNIAVVEELHFGNESHLCHEFQKFYGVSPQTFAPTFRESSERGKQQTRDLT